MERARLNPTTTKISKNQEAHTSAPQNTPALTLAQHILHLQRTVGNRAVGRLVQAQLTVSRPGDTYEREADRVAEQVTSMPSPESTPTAQRQVMPEEDQDQQPLQTKPLAASLTPLVPRQAMPEEEKQEEPPVQREPLAEKITPLAPRQLMPEEEQEEEQLLQPTSRLQRSAGEERGEAGHGIAQQLGHSRGKGSALPESVRSYMEPRFGTDFSGVRVHTDGESQDLNRSLNAEAFTVGQDIYYGAGQSPTDLRLTAHELTHVVQQMGGATMQRKLARGAPVIFLQHGEDHAISRARADSLDHELTPGGQQDGERLRRARTQAKGGAATSGAPSGRDKGPLNFLFSRVSAVSQPDRSPAPMLDLQRQAGNRAASAVLLARRTETGEGDSGKRVEHGPAPEREIVDPASGRSMRRLRVDGLPNAFTDWAIVLLPSTPPPVGKPIDILLHLHGFSPGYEGLGHTEGRQPNTDPDDIDLYRISPQMAAAGRAMVGILPQGSNLSDFNANDPKKSAKQNAISKGFDADTYVSAVFARLAEMGVWRGGGAPTPGNVVLSGHSGADMPIAQMVSGELGPAKLSALFLFDTMYPGAGFERTIWEAIRRRLDQDLFALSAIDAAGAGSQATTERRMVEWVRENGFRVYNVHGGVYGRSSQYLVTQRDAWLKANKHLVGPKGSPVFQAIVANLQVTSGGGGHWGIIGADDHLRTAIDMLPGKNPKAPPGPAGPADAQRSVQRQPAPDPAPQRTRAQQVDDAAERVRDAVRAGGRAARRHGERRRHRRHCHPADHLPTSQPQRWAAPTESDPPRAPALRRALRHRRGRRPRHDRHHVTRLEGR